MPSKVIKGANTVRTSDATATDDPDLIFALAAQGFYEIEGSIKWGNSATLTVPNTRHSLAFTGALIFANGIIHTNNRPHGAPSWRDADNIGFHLNINAGVLTNATQWVTVTSAGTPGTAILLFRCYLKVGDTGGNFSYRWGQGTSTVNPTTIYKDSYIYYAERAVPT